MERAQFLEQVRAKREQGLSIRAIASLLGAHRSRVHRALQSLSRGMDSLDASPLLPASLPDRPAGSPFVGREREIAELKGALDDALAGRARCLMLVGEPGIGKTRTGQELAAHGMELGFQVLWGRCYSAQGAPPFWPWLQAIRSYIRQQSPEELRTQMGAGAADIAEVVPEVRERLPGLETPPALEPQQARFRFFDSMAAFLMRACQDQPLLLLLDNLHWADRPSLLLLEFLSQELAQGRLLMVGTYRDAEINRRHPLTQTLGELAREPSFQRVPLRGLSEAEVGKFLKGMAGFTPPRDLVTAVHTQTEGNPLFMTQVVQLLIQEGELTPARERWNRDITIPVGVREVIGMRLDRLSGGCNYALTVASVIGREFELGLLEGMVADPAIGSAGSSLSEEELLEAVAEALAARVIEEIPQAVSRYQFTHVLIQDILAQEMLAVRRARLHHRIAEALEELYVNDLQSHAAELAFHYGEAATVTGTEKLVRYSLLAGERALASYAWEDALMHFNQALETKEGEPMDPETAELLFGLARANLGTLEQFEIQRMRESVAQLGRAFNYYTEIGELDRAVAVAEYPVRAALGVPIGEGELITRALALVSADSHQAGRLLANSGLILYQEKGDYPGAQEAFSQALVLARREQDTALEMRILANATSVDFHHLRWQECLEKGAQAVKLSDGVDDLYAATFGSFFTALMALGVAFVGGIIAGNSGEDGVNQVVEGLSSFLAGKGALAPLGIALAAGLVSVVNPCGFAMLPAYQLNKSG